MGRHRAADALAGRRRLAATLAWSGFALAWYFALRHASPGWYRALWVPAVSLLAVSLVTVGWIRHNLAIYRRKGPRRALPARGGPWAADTLGRPLEFTGPALDAPVVLLCVERGRKVYRAAP